MEYYEIMRAEVKVDIYDGENCDEHRKYWNAYAEGDMQDDDFSEDIILRFSDYPVGTKVSVSVPSCPECYVPSDMCECGFDWKNWAESIYG